MAVRPDVVDVVNFEQTDSMDVRARSFPAGADFLNQSGFSSFQFGADDENDDAWTDEDGDDDVDQECRQQ